MNFLNYQSSIKILLKNHNSCSLVNADGLLLYSKDLNHELLTTSRLVAFQIVKKYLSPKPQDFFVLNDPENGGYQFSKLIFIFCLNSNLYLIWDENNFYIDFKIPPTPLFEQGIKNDFVWQALIHKNKYSTELENFFDFQKNNMDRILKLNDLLNLVTSHKNQQIWLSTTNEIFSIQFSSKAHGGHEAQYPALKNQLIKLKFSAEEKQNQKLITLDFTHTGPACEIHAASHIIESVLVKKIIDFYQIDDFFTQSVLDKIKIILPPRSIVSKSHATGDYNLELQSVCSQLCEHNMKQLNSHTRKTQAVFEYANYLNFELSIDNCHTTNIFSTLHSQLNKFENLISAHFITLTKMTRIDATYCLNFKINTDLPAHLNIKNNYLVEKSTNSIKLNDKILARGPYDLSKNDSVEIVWG